MSRYRRLAFLAALAASLAGQSGFVLYGYFLPTGR